VPAFGYALGDLKADDSPSISKPQVYPATAANERSDLFQSFENFYF
jgi:hypothetical protein